MALKKLEIVGFKSFAKKTSLAFASSITAIVGPNGSGKSNAAEAFRFVLGEQSMKSLRGKRTEDLIFNGSSKVSRSNRASVKLVFDNTPRPQGTKRARLLDMDFDEVSLERIIHRDASSEYAINGSAVRLKDIQELLAGANIGSSGHHIISQGAADRVLSVNPRERREMIEDALGLRVYQYKIDESTKKLEKTQQNIKEVESLRREIKPHLNFLKKQVEKVERAQEIRDELTERYKEYFRRETLYVEKEKKRIAGEHEPLTKEKQKLELEKREAEDRLAELDAETISGSGTEALERALREVREKKDTLARTIGRLEGSIDAEKRRIASAVKAPKDERLFSESEVRGVLDVVEKRLIDAEQLNVLTDIHDLLRGLREKVRAFWGKEKDNSDDASAEASDAELQKLEKEYTSREKEMAELSGKEEELQTQIREQKREFEKEQHESREVERSIFQIRERLQKISGHIGRLEGDAERLELIKEERERELLEARVIVGREAVHYNEAILQDSEGNVLTPEEAATEDRAVQEARKRAVEKLKIRLEEAGAGSGDEVLKEFEQVSERDTFLKREIDDLERSAASLATLISELTETLEKNFKSGLAQINEAFGDFFSVMFGGGTASLKLVVEKRKRRAADDILGIDDDEEGKVEEEGIEIAVSLPRKKIRGLEMLSGGERALTSIALIFAMSQVNPPPFLILDETDAALDEANSRRYGDMIERLAERSQLILITHNRETMSRADVLYGVTMGSDGVSQVLSVGFTEAVQVAK